eukprot:TRINITY_DN44187_c0_g1_i1.p2 TRINITY_DN44187_c0_g1~~TRINITY_DN44187_c0_g1_i1.p2  ORF type:complete len:151 (+),score=12.16 TRINITY_DN44187_c0_g1_i1:49-501(+)
MTRIKRRYLLGRVHGATPGSGQAVIQEILKTVGELYGELGSAELKGQTTLKWQAPGGSWCIFRVPGSGYRKFRTALVLTQSIGSVPTRIDVLHTTGSIGKAIVKMKEATQSDARRCLRAMRLLGKEPSEVRSIVEAQSAVEASLGTVEGA